MGLHQIKVLGTPGLLHHRSFLSHHGPWQWKRGASKRQSTFPERQPYAGMVWMAEVLCRAKREPSSEMISFLPPILYLPFFPPSVQQAVATTLWPSVPSWPAASPHARQPSNRTSSPAVAFLVRT